MPQKTCYYVSETIEQNAPQTKYVLIRHDPQTGCPKIDCYLSEADAEEDRQMGGGSGWVMPYANRSEVVEVQTMFGKVWHKKPRVRKSNKSK